MRAAFARESEEPGLREVAGDYRSGKTRELCFLSEFLENDCRRARFRKNDRGGGSDELASSLNDSSQGACRDAQTRSNALFVDARGAEGLEARVRLRPY